MRISEAFCKMRLSEYCTSQDVDRAIAVMVDSFVGGQKVSCKKALARAFAKYVLLFSSALYFVLGEDTWKMKMVANEINRYTLKKPGNSQRSQGGRNGVRETAVMA